MTGNKANSPGAAPRTRGEGVLERYLGARFSTVRSEDLGLHNLRVCVVTPRIVPGGAALRGAAARKRTAMSRERVMAQALGARD